MDLKKSLCCFLFATGASFLTSQSIAQQHISHKKSKTPAGLLEFADKNVLSDLLPISDGFAIKLNQSGNYDFEGYAKIKTFYDKFTFQRSDTLKQSKELHQTFSDGQYTITAVIDEEKENDDMDFMPGFKSLTLSDGKHPAKDILKLMWDFNRIEQENTHLISDRGVADNSMHQKQKELCETLYLFIDQFGKYKAYYMQGETNLHIAGQTYTAL